MSGALLKSGCLDVFSAVNQRSTDTIKRCLEQGTDIDDLNEEGITPLGLASEKGYVEVIAFLLDNGASTSTTRGFAPIHSAADFGQTEAVKMLLDHGADIQSVTYWGATALHLAAGHNDVKTTQLLLEQGADKNALNMDEETPLMGAVWCGGLEVVELLVAHGCDFETADKSGHTPIVRAALQERFDIVNFLHESGASLERSPKMGQTLLHYAASLGRFNVVQFLCSKMDLASANLVDHHGNTAIHLAAQSSHAAIVELLLRKGIDPNCKNNNGDTAIFDAIASNSIQAVKFLLEKCPNLEIRDGENHIPLQKACFLSHIQIVALLFPKTPNLEKYIKTFVTLAVRRKGGCVLRLLQEAAETVAIPNRKLHLLHAIEAGNAETVKVFLDKWAEMEEYIRSDTTAISMAIRKRKHLSTQLLLKRGAKINQVMIGERPALHYAIHIKDVNFVETFLQYGADLKALFDGHTPLLSVILDIHMGSSFRQTRSTEICNLLLAQDDPGLELTTPGGYTALHLAVTYELTDILKPILDKGADMEATLPDCGSTPLLVACRNKNMDIAEVLINKGCNLEAINMKGRTALYRTIVKHQTDMARFLLLQGADPEHGNSGWTPLHRAAQYGHEEMVRLLLDYGANPESDNDGSTPLSKAVLHGHANIVQFLLEKRGDTNAKPDQALLNEASKQGHVEVVRVLLDNSADPGNEGDDATALGNAIQYGHTDTVKLLLERGAWPGSGSYKGDYLKKAARKNRLDIVRLLVEHGAGLEVSGEHRRTALHHAAGHGNLDIVQYLVTQFPDSLHFACGCCRYIPIHYAASEGHLQVLQYLLGQYTDPSPSFGKASPLAQAEEAIINSESRQCQQERRSGVHVKSCTFGATPLHRAARKGHQDIVQYLLNNGADQSVQTFRGATPLALASRFGREEVVKLLLKNPGYDLATRDAAGRTALFLAASRGHCGVIETLVAASALKKDVILQKDMYGATPISVALRNGHEQSVIQLLKAAQPSLDSLDFGGKTLGDWVQLMASSHLRNLLFDSKPGDLDMEIDHKCDTAEEDEQSEDEESNNNPTECSVCLRPTEENEAPYKCDVCHTRIFRQCRDCFDLGLKCPFESHSLTLCEETDGEEEWTILPHRPTDH